MKKSLCILSICFAALACGSACKQYNNPENTDDPKTEIKQVIQAAALPVYREEIVVGAKGDRAEEYKVAGTGILAKHDMLIQKGGNQEDDFLYAIIAFDKCQENVPTALYFGGENGEETVKVEKIQMITPELALCEMPDTFHIALVEPIQMATENIDGAPADSYLVDLKTILGGQMAKFDVRRADEVENNLEKFAEKCFLDLVFQQKQVFATGVSQVLKAVADGGSYPKVYYEWLIQFGGKK